MTYIHNRTRCSERIWTIFHFVLWLVYLRAFHQHSPAEAACVRSYQLLCMPGGYGYSCVESLWSGSKAPPGGHNKEKLNLELLNIRLTIFHKAINNVHNIFALIIKCKNIKEEVVHNSAVPSLSDIPAKFKTNSGEPSQDTSHTAMKTNWDKTTNKNVWNKIILLLLLLLESIESQRERSSWSHQTIEITDTMQRFIWDFLLQPNEDTVRYWSEQIITHSGSYFETLHDGPKRVKIYSLQYEYRNSFSNWPLSWSVSPPFCWRLPSCYQTPPHPS